LGPGKRPVALKTGQKAVQMEHLMQLSILGFINFLTTEGTENMEVKSLSKRRKSHENAISQRC
jgi:hypothetical protein